MKYLILVLVAAFLISCSSESDSKAEAIKTNTQADLLRDAGNLDSALVLYDQAIALDKTYYKPHSNKFGIYLVNQEYDKALYESEMAIKKNPQLAEGWFFTGLLTEYLGDSKKAVTYYKRSIKVYTDRINNPEEESKINSNKLNRAVSKKFVGDESYIEDFDELRKIESFTLYIDRIRYKTKEQIIDELIK